MIQWRYNLLLALLVISTLFLCLSCDKNTLKHNGDENEEYEWYDLGFEDKLALRLRLYKPYLYVCAGSDGLWRKEIESNYSDWEYLGFADTTFGYLHYGVRDILINSDNSDLMLAAVNAEDARVHGIFKTEDGGNTWVASDSGLGFHFPPPWDTETYFEHPTIFLQTPYDLFAAGTKIFHTNNFGETWEKITAIGPPPAATTRGFRCHSEDTNVLWLGGESVYFSPILNFSMDGGATWDYVPLNTMVTVDNAVYSIAFDPYDSDVVYVSLFKEIIKTTDGGASWIIPLMSYDGPGQVRCMVEDDTRSGHLFAAAGYTTFETKNGGESWVDLESPNISGILSMVYDPEEKALYIGTGYVQEPSGVFVYK
jgi:photosystem II stability/assembly factor-like uncharacterized protein